MRNLATALLLMVFLATAPKADASKAFVWLDLGNVILETRNGYDKVHYMPGVLEYLEQIKNDGHKVGLIVNIPESWGKPDDYPSKIQATLDFIRGGWIDAEKTFSFDVFDEVVIPMRNTQRKPAPDLFMKALEVSKNLGLRPFYQSEDAEEIEVAQSIGFKAHKVELEGPEARYLPLEKIQLLTVEGLSK